MRCASEQTANVKAVTGCTQFVVVNF